MITYELAKKLKEAGYKFEIAKDHEPCYWFDNIPFKIPTLSELIEACGDEFYSLIRSMVINDKGYFWFVKSGKPSIDDCPILIYGKTPEEAVAYLWLRLNEKK